MKFCHQKYLSRVQGELFAKIYAIVVCKNLGIKITIKGST